MDDLAVFRKNLRYLRRRNGFSQDFIAQFLHKKSYTTIQKWETGDSQPSIKECLALCRLFNVSIDDLINVDLEESE